MGLEEWLRAKSSSLEPTARKLTLDSSLTAWEASLRNNPVLAEAFGWSTGRPLPEPPALERMALGLAVHVEEPVKHLLEALGTDNSSVEVRLKGSGSFVHDDVEQLFQRVEEVVGRVPIDVVIRRATPGASSYGWHTDAVSMPADHHAHI